MWWIALLSNQFFPVLISHSFLPFVSFRYQESYFIIKEKRVKFIIILIFKQDFNPVLVSLFVFTFEGSEQRQKCVEVQRPEKDKFLLVLFS